MEKNKKETPEQIRKNVSKKLFTEQLKKTSNDNPPKKTVLNNRIVNTSGSFDFANVRPKGFAMTKAFRNKTIEKPKKENKDSVFSELGKIPLTDRKIIGNAADMMPEEKLKVNKQYQNRVNKILGK